MTATAAHTPINQQQNDRMSRVIRVEIADDTPHDAELNAVLEQHPEEGDVVHLHRTTSDSVWLCERVVDGVSLVARIVTEALFKLAMTSQYTNAYARFKPTIDYFLEHPRLSLRVEFLVSDIGFGALLGLDCRAHACTLTSTPTSRSLSLQLLQDDPRRLVVRSDENEGTDRSLDKLAEKLRLELRAVLSTSETFVCCVSDGTPIKAGELPLAPVVRLDGHVGVYHNWFYVCELLRKTPQARTLVFHVPPRLAEQFQRDLYRKFGSLVIALLRSGPQRQFTFNEHKWEGYLPGRLTVDYPELRRGVLHRYVTELTLVFCDRFVACDLVELFDRVPETRFYKRRKRHAQIDRLYNSIKRVRSQREQTEAKRLMSAAGGDSMPHADSIGDSMPRADSIQSARVGATQ